MSFDYDAFISYTHIDNVGLVDGSKGWITNLHRALEIRIAQFLGEKPQIWRDPKLAGNDVFENTLVEQLNRVAALITVVSPRYVKSEWTRRELVEFWKAAEAQGGVRLHDKARIFKVMKTPVPREMDLPELQPLLGYEFFKIDTMTGRVRELDEIFGPEAQRDFWMKLDDLAHDICALLEMLRRETLTDHLTPGDERCAVYLAETTRDLTEQREAIRRDLQQHGHIVLPAKGLPLSEPQIKTAMEEDLAVCRMSIHLIGNSYGLVPEGSSISMIEIQNQLAIERGRKGGFSRLIWIPAGMKTEDERQAAMIERLRMDASLQEGGDLLETYLEDLRTVIHDRLQQKTKPASEVARVSATERYPSQIYTLYDQRDSELAMPCADALFDQGFEVLHPCFEGGEAEVRQCHEENLRICDGVLIFFGTTHAGWVRQKLREIQKSVGYGRTEPPPKIAISYIGPKTVEKEHFRTHEALVLVQTESSAVDCLQPFVALMKT
jgi:Domain of unknown function (DUF4062)